jgi:hypothetical protein
MTEFNVNVGYKDYLLKDLEKEEANQFPCGSEERKDVSSALLRSGEGYNENMNLGMFTNAANLDNINPNFVLMPEEEKKEAGNEDLGNRGEGSIGLYEDHFDQIFYYLKTFANLKEENNVVLEFSFPPIVVLPVLLRTGRTTIGGKLNSRTTLFSSFKFANVLR